jgi:hypothetical protein
MRKHSALDKKRRTADDGPSQRKRRKHRKRLPKNFDPENPGPMPDPERWLPKWQRSDYKKKRTRRKEKVRTVFSCMAGTDAGCLSLPPLSLSLPPCLPLSLPPCLSLCVSPLLGCKTRKPFHERKCWQVVRQGAVVAIGGNWVRQGAVGSWA